MIFLLGPTAVGKSAFAVELALICDAEIVGADAFQIYEGLDILTAQPSRALQEAVPHHLIGEIPRSRTFDVAQYSERAQAHIAAITGGGRRAMIVGGTGLYVRALTRGLADLPRSDSLLRAELAALDPGELTLRLRAIDPESARVIDLANRRRVERAVEVSLLTGRPYSSFRTQWNAPPSRAHHGFILTRPRAELCKRIEQRTDAMFADGVIEEVRDAGPLSITAEQAIGVRDIRALLRGEIDRAECVDQINQATKRYAKRQLTWFRQEKAFEQVDLASGVSPASLAKRLDPL